MENNIAAFVHVFYPKGGAETVTSHIAKYLINKGYTIFIFATEINIDQLPDNHPAVNLIELPNKFSDSKENAIFLVDEIKKNNINFLFSKDIINQWKYIGENTECKMVFTHHSLPLWESRERLSAMQMATIGSPMKTLEWYLYRVPKSFIKNPNKRLKKDYKRLYESVDAYTVLCDDYKQDTAKIVGSCDKLYTLINPTIEPQERINLNKKKQVLFTGRLDYAAKRVDRLIRVWGKICRTFPDWELLIVGDGEDEANLRKLAESLNLINYKFCGYTRNINTYLQTASIICLTSVHEGWPLSLTEAQVYGVVPVSVKCCDGVKAILSPDGENGVIVDSFSVAKFSRRLSEVMADDALRAKIQRNVIQKAKEYSIENIGKQWDKMLKELYEER